MIQGYLTELCREALPDLMWSTDFRSTQDNTAAVYSEAGNPPRTKGDVDMRYPAYMVLIRSSDWDKTIQSIEKVRNHLHRRFNFQAVEKHYDKNNNVIGQTPYHVFSLVASTEPIRLGPDDNQRLEYSINFDATLKQLEEE